MMTPATRNNNNNNKQLTNNCLAFRLIERTQQTHEKKKTAKIETLQVAYRVSSEDWLTAPEGRFNAGSVQSDGTACAKEKRKSIETIKCHFYCSFLFPFIVCSSSSSNANDKCVMNMNNNDANKKHAIQWHRPNEHRIRTCRT